MAIFKKFKKGLTKSRESFSSGITNALKRHPKIDALLWENLEEVLIASDVGFEPTLEIIDKVKERAKREKISDSSEVKDILRDEISKILDVDNSEMFKEEKQIVIVLGVNGVGKTTTIAKIANYLKQQSKEVMFAAADSFRAAAIEQLQEWASRVGVKVVRHERGSDPAAVVFDTIESAKARGVDYVIADTAGRLHTQANLMEELKKIKRVAVEKAEDYKVKTLLVLDAATGQNALVQTELFNKEIGVDEIALSKMDGTAKGGIIIAIAQQFKIPVSFIGLGENLEDIEEFDAKMFAEALVGD